VVRLNRFINFIKKDIDVFKHVLRKPIKKSEKDDFSGLIFQNLILNKGYILGNFQGGYEFLICFKNRDDFFIL